MGPIQKAVLQKLAALDGGATLGALAHDTGEDPAKVHAALVVLADKTLVNRSDVRGLITYTITPLGERMAEGIGEE